MSALHKVSFPVPKPLLFCADRNVIGTEFYIMELIKVRLPYEIFETKSCLAGHGTM